MLRIQNQGFRVSCFGFRAQRETDGEYIKYRAVVTVVLTRVFCGFLGVLGFWREILNVLSTLKGLLDTLI